MRYVTGGEKLIEVIDKYNYINRKVWYDGKSYQPVGGLKFYITLAVAKTALVRGLREEVDLLEASIVEVKNEIKLAREAVIP